MFDMLIKNGNVVDGTGTPGVVKDIAIKDGKIVALGEGITGASKEVLDATGLLVTPGFVDIHTHYDGQVLWDNELRVSSANGVTTCVMGNCGVSMAPVKQKDIDWLAYVLDVVEEVPVAAVRETVDFDWESFPEYMDALDKKGYTLDLVAQVPHSALRAYVMGERGIRNEPATPEDIAEMARLVKEAVEAGAFGFSTARSYIINLDTGPLPGTLATEEELFAIAGAIEEAGGGVIQMIPSGQTGVVEGDGKQNQMAGFKPDPYFISDEVKLMRRLHQKTGVGCTFSFGCNPRIGEDWPRVMAEIDAAHKAGEPIYPQTAARLLTALVNLDGHHIFLAKPTYRAIAHLPCAERARKMADPAIKAAILSEPDADLGGEDPLQMFWLTIRNQIKAVFPYEGKDTDYEPVRERSIVAQAKASGRDPHDLFYDMLIAEEGKAIMIWFADYVPEATELKYKLFNNPGFSIGSGDAGAHAKLMVDGGIYTYLLARWAKNRASGDPIPVETLVHRSTKLVADLYGLDDRGVIAEGKRADLNVIDFEKLDFERPHFVYDFPGNAPRYVQDGIGYVMTMVNGVPVRRNDKDTGARPGKVARNPRALAKRRLLEAA